MVTDVLVVGSGIAGLFFSLKIPDKYKVTVVTKKGKEEASTNLAQGGIAAVFGDKDSFELHVEDTIRVGEGLCNRERVELMVREAPRLVNELRDLGVKFSTNSQGDYDLGREAAHSRRRIVHAKDLTGETIENALIYKVHQSGNIEILEDKLALDVVILGNRCVGLWTYNPFDDEIEFISSKIILIATGGVGSLYLYTTNPSVSTGDGVAMAKRAGLGVANMEFIQFHPTSLFVEPTPERAFLISEVVRGEGAILVNKEGESFVEKYHPLGSLAPRDIVSRSIAMELKRSGDNHVYLDLSRIQPERIKKRFPNIYKTCIAYGIDITKEPIPCLPAAHYLCGGIVVDENGFTGIEGLYAAGETSCVGVHGANRLASNSLLESVVFSERAAQHSIANITRKQIEYVEPSYKDEILPKEEINNLVKTIKRIMWDKLGIIRNVKDMTDAKEAIDSMLRNLTLEWEKNIKPNRDYSKLRNMIIVAKSIISCALKRKESRGLHWVADYPNKDPEYENNTID